MEAGVSQMDAFKRRLLRTKTIISQSSVDEETGGETQGRELKKVLTTLDLVSLGVGSCCGTGMYVVAGLVARDVAGPGVILSFVVAAIASILSGGLTIACLYSLRWVNPDRERWVGVGVEKGTGRQGVLPLIRKTEHAHLAITVIVTL